MYGSEFGTVGKRRMVRLMKSFLSTDSKCFFIISIPNCSFVLVGSICFKRLIINFVEF